MELQTALDSEIIKINLQALNKQEVFEKLAELLYDNNYILNVDKFIEDVYNREGQGTTGIGNYIAIPHAKSSYVNKPGVAIGVLNEEIEWETLDDNGVKVIILFAVTDNNEGAEDYLKLLATFAKKLGNDEVVDSLLEASTVEQIIESFN